MIMLNWSVLSEEAQLSALLQESYNRPQLIFKHSTRCSVSQVAKTRLERSPELPPADFHYLDLLAHRSLSNRIAEDLKVYHESPQVLLVHRGECVYDESHLSISMEEITEQVEMLASVGQ